jgi:hypothetical protein
MSDDFERFTTPRADEELHQGVEAPVVMGTSPEDGLPMQVAQRNFDKAPALSEETLICMADKRSFVVRHEFSGAVVHSWPAAVVKRFPNGIYIAPMPKDQQELWAMSERAQEDFPVLDLAGEKWVVVEPIRPQCAHYLRQQTDLSADRDHRYYARACMAQKTEDGEYYSLRDTLIGACSIREPRHLESEITILDKFDEEKMLEAQTKSEMEEFDVDKALAEEARNGGLGVLGG